MILGECQWTSTPADRTALATLVEEKTRWIVPREGRWHVYFLGYSRSRWTESAMQYAQELNSQVLFGLPGFPGDSARVQPR